VLAVVMAANRNLEEAMASLRKISERCSVTLLATPSAVKDFGADKIRAAAGVNDLLVADKAPSAVDLTQSHDVLVFATLSMNGLSKLTTFAVDSSVFITAYYFFQAGKPIFAARDGLWCTRFPEPAPGSPAGRKAEEMLNGLKSMGVRVCSAKTLGSEVLWSVGEPGFASSLGRTTVGTAGKVFQGAASPARPAEERAPVPAPKPLESHGGEHTGTASCPHCQSIGKLNAPALQALGAERLSVCRPSEKGHEVAFLIDHTLLKPNATQEEVGKLCEEAKKYCFASVCINPAYVPLAAQLLRGSGVRVCTVIGFPLGSTTPTVKAIEARDAIANGADEIDMVINVGAVKSGNYALVLDDIRAVRDATRGKVLKVIIETAYLTREEKVKACELSKEAGADFVKTSTGFGPGGATVEDIALMRSVVGPTMGVKASGGIRDQETALKMVEAGATRIGASASVSITMGKKAGEGKY